MSKLPLHDILFAEKVGKRLVELEKEKKTGGTMANRAYENYQNRIGLRGAAQHHKARMEREAQMVLELTARSMYESVFPLPEREVWERMWSEAWQDETRGAIVSGGKVVEI